MGKIAVAGIALIAAAAAVSGCKKAIREQPEPEQPASISITWEFKRVDRGPDPYTEAAFIINGNQMHKYTVGVYYGRVRKILSPQEINPAMVGGTLSGFITTNEGRGHEVIVRYNEQLRRLIIAAREWSEHLPPGPYGAIKSIPVPEMKKERTGF